MIDEESFAIDAGIQAAERVVAGTKLDEIQRRAAVEAATVAVRTAVATFRKHTMSTADATGERLTDRERAAWHLFTEACRVLKAETT